MPMSIDVADHFESRPIISAWDTEILNREGALAAALIERWGLVMGTPDGEDSAGRQQLKLMPPADLVERACDTAAKTMEAFRARGWVTLAPTFDAAREMIEKRREEKRNGAPKGRD